MMQLRRYGLLPIFILCMLLSMVGTPSTDAQATGIEIFFGETQNGIFETGGDLVQRWFIAEDTRAGDILTMRAYRIAGQFTPRLRLLNSVGDLVAESSGTQYSDYDELVISEGLPEDDFYQVEVRGINVIANQPDNPAEYALTLLKSGERKASRDEGLIALPNVGMNRPPDLQTGNATRLDIGFDVYGARPTLTRSDTANIPARFLVETPQWQLIVNNVNPVQSGVLSATFTETGIGMTLRNDNNSGVFFSDENFMIAYVPQQRVYTFTLAETGTRIVTDFSQIESIEVQDGVVGVRLLIDGIRRRMVFNGDLVDVRRIAGGGDSNEERITRINLENEQSIVSDLEGWDTLAYLDGRLRVLYGQDARLITDLVRIDLRQNDNNPQQHDIDVLVPNGSGGTRPLRMQLHWSRMGDVQISPEQLIIAPLDNRLIAEPIQGVSSLLIANAGVQITRNDDTYRTSFPDGTDIETPATLVDNTDVLPHQDGFRASNNNNLGEDFITMCPCVEQFLTNQPVNPANGNYFYSVTDFDIPSHTLGLNLTRYYNSQDTGITPDYMLASTEASTATYFGDGWRHSYQYELDISGAPLGRVRLVDPDGTQHYFRPVQGQANLWESRTLLSWRIRRVGGILGSWQGTRSDGVTFVFDRAGRLERISETDTRSIIITPVPFTYDTEGTGGAFIIEPYGRRIELYNGLNGRIARARDTSQRQITYSYDADNPTRLTGVEYISATQTASYRYNDNGVLNRFDDPRSPYYQEGLITYNSSLQVQQVVNNPDGTLPQAFRYVYQTEGDERNTIEITNVRGSERRVTWQYNSLYQLTNTSTPQTGVEYEFTYNGNTGLLETYRTPTQVRFNVRFDGNGNLTRFEDPFFTGESAYTLTYEQRGAQSLVTRITYPNGYEQTFTWSEDAYPRLLSYRELVAVGQERTFRTTRYEYDSYGRLVMRIEPQNIATVYIYDEYGYVQTIWEGVELGEGETRADITSSSRARRVLNYDYDLIGQVRAITDGRGQIYSLNWDSSIEKLRQVTASQDVVVSYTYDERGRMTTVDDRGQITQYDYNGLDLITSVNQEGVVLTFDYDEAGNLIRQVDDAQRTTTYRYDALDNPVLVTSPSGLETRYSTTIAADEIVRTEVDPDGRTITRQYDSLGRLRRYSINDGDFTQEFRLTYNNVNYPTEIVEALTGRALTLEYDLVGQVQAISVANARTQFQYNPRGLLTQVTSPAGRVTRYAYDPLGNIEQVTLPDGNPIGYEYDENSNLLSQTDPTGLVTTYVYDALNQLVSVEDPQGLTELYNYDVRGNLVNIIDPRNISRTFEYDALDNLVRATDGIGRTTTYEYDTLGRLQTIQQPAVRSTRLTYDEEDNIIAVTERPREQRTLYSYDRLGRINTLTDPLGHTTSYIYNSIGRVRRIIDAIGNEDNYRWRQGTVTLSRYIDNAGREFEYITDELGRVEIIRDRTAQDDGRQPINTEYTYDADGYIRSIQSGTDQTRVSGNNDIFHRYEYDANGRPIRYTDPNDGEWALAYDASGNLISVTNPLGVTTAYQYDNSGRVVAVVNALNTPEETIERFTYDRSGNVEFYTAPDGTRNRYIYDPNNRLLQAIIALDTDLESVYNFEYNALGQLIRSEDPLGTETSYFYSLDNLTRVVRELSDDESIDVTYSFDDAGNLTTITLPGRDETTNAPITNNITYDALNRPVRFVNGEDNVWSYTYDAAGNIAQISDPLGSVVQYEYNNYNKVTRITYPNAAGSVELRYDAAGNLRNVVLPPNVNGSAQTITYVLDVSGNVTEIRDGTSTTRYQYDVMGNLTQRTLADGRVTNYEYDASGRLITIRYDNGDTIDYTYDAAGRVLRAGQLSYDYDALGRVIREQNGDFVVNYTYDLVGNLLARDAGALGRTFYSYDAFYRPEQIELNGESIRIVYDARGQVRQILRSNGVRSIFSYDAAGRPVSILHLGADGRLDGFNYQYSAVGNLIRIDRIIDGWRISYAYDVAHRLISERWVNEDGETMYAVSFRYDEAGNRTEELRDGRRTEFVYNDQNQLIGEARNFDPQDDFIWLPTGAGLLLGVGLLFVRRRRRKWWAILPLSLVFAGAVLAQTPPLDVRYEYNPNGNLTRITYAQSNNALNFSYDAEGRLVRISGTDEAGNAVETGYRYDPLSRLVEWQSGEIRQQFFYDGRTRIGSIDNGDEVFERYLTFDDQQWLTQTNDASRWHLNDLLGSTRKFTDGTGALLDVATLEREFGSFGVRIYPYNDGVPPDNSQLNEATTLYNNLLFDPVAQLYLTDLRAYQPELGRFLQPDALRQDPIGTLYTYARNRPFVFTDPTGLVVEPFVDPTDAALLTDLIEPEALIPRPATPEIPLPPTVHRQQADETFRALELLHDTRYGTNEVVAGVSPLLDEFFYFRLNPMPDAMRQVSAAPLTEMMSIYHSGDGWLPDPRTNPTMAVDPFAVLHESSALLAQAYAEPLVWSAPRVDTRLLPQVSVPQGLSNDWQIERSLTQGLQQVPLMSALDGQTQSLTSLLAQSPAPAPQLPQVQVPSAPVEPPILQSLDSLRESTYDIVQRVWSFDDCVDCVAPLGFNR